ncbi:MAG: hypothetical protein R3F43_14135 [bacterium]
MRCSCPDRRPRRVLAAGGSGGAHPLPAAEHRRRGGARRGSDTRVPVVPDAGLQMRAPRTPRARTAVVVTSPGAWVVRHPGGEGAEEPRLVPEAGRLSRSSLGTPSPSPRRGHRTGIRPGLAHHARRRPAGRGAAGPHPAPAGERMTSMPLRLGSWRRAPRATSPATAALSSAARRPPAIPGSWGDRSIAVTER